MTNKNHATTSFEIFNDKNIQINLKHSLFFVVQDTNETEVLSTGVYYH